MRQLGSSMTPVFFAMLQQGPRSGPGKKGFPDTYDHALHIDILNTQEHDLQV